MDTLLQDMAYALRGLRRRPAFTAIVVGTIALGVGANAAIFSVVSGLLLRPLPYPHAEQLVSIGHEAPKWLTSDADFLEYKRDLKTVTGIAAYVRREATLTVGDTPKRVATIRATEDFFPVLGVQPLLGRTFSDDEYVPSVAPVVVMSYELWQRDFGGDRGILGRKVSLEGMPRVVVGVMPPRFAYPETHMDLWLPQSRLTPDSASRFNYYLWVVARLKPGVTVQELKTEATGVAARIMASEPGKYDPTNPLRPTVKTVPEVLVGSTRPYLFALVGAVGFVLLIACANVANLLLVHGEARRKELALRSALGASGKRLVAQLLTESALLSCAGAAIGLGIAWVAVRALVAAAPAAIPRIDEVVIDWRVLAFTAMITAVTSVLVGAAPAWRVARDDAAATLKEGGKTTRAASGKARRMLVAAELALAVAVLSGTGMLLRSLWHLQGEQLGFEPSGVLTAKVAPLAREYTDERSVQFYDQLVNGLRAMPNVTAAAAVGWLPVADAGGLWAYRPEGTVYADGRSPAAVPQQITPGYFKAMGIRILAGRDFDAGDRPETELVAIVSRKFAELSWLGQSAIGRRFQLDGEAPLLTVVGVVEDLRARGFGDTPEPTMYFAYAQTAKSAYFMPRTMYLVVRSSGDPAQYAAALREQVRALDRNAPVSQVRTLEDVAGTSIALRRFNTTLLASFAALALILAGIGTYGVISYGVSQRRFEIGVRMALGAENGSVLSLVMSEGMRLAAIGLAIGLGASVVVGRVIRAMLVGVSTVDAPSLLGTTLALVTVAAIATLIPARRALRVSPLEALRSE